VDEAQIELLGAVVLYVARTAALPPRRAQGETEGIQFYNMHTEIVGILEAKRRTDPGGPAAS
jgi:hypothetical protein